MIKLKRCVNIYLLNAVGAVIVKNIKNENICMWITFCDVLLNV